MKKGGRIPPKEQLNDDYVIIEKAQEAPIWLKNEMNYSVVIHP